LFINKRFIKIKRPLKRYTKGGGAAEEMPELLDARLKLSRWREAFRVAARREQMTRGGKQNEKGVDVSGTGRRERTFRGACARSS
jgi:hypothetical protein